MNGCKREDLHIGADFVRRLLDLLRARTIILNISINYATRSISTDSNKINGVIRSHTFESMLVLYIYIYIYIYIFVFFQISSIRTNKSSAWIHTWLPTKSAQQFSVDETESFDKFDYLVSLAYTCLLSIFNVLTTAPTVGTTPPTMIDGAGSMDDAPSATDGPAMPYAKPTARPAEGDYLSNNAGMKTFYRFTT